MILRVLRLPINMRAQCEARPASVNHYHREGTMNTATVATVQQQPGSIIEPEGYGYSGIDPLYVNAMKARRDKLAGICKTAPTGSRGAYYVVRTLDMDYLSESGERVSIEDAVRMHRNEAISLAADTRTERGPNHAIHVTDALLAHIDALDAYLSFIERERKGSSNGKGGVA